MLRMAILFIWLHDGSLKFSIIALFIRVICRASVEQTLHLSFAQAICRVNFQFDVSRVTNWVKIFSFGTP